MEYRKYPRGSEYLCNVILTELTEQTENTEFFEMLNKPKSEVRLRPRDATHAHTK